MKKLRFLGVHPETIARFGAVSPQVAVEMALGVREKSHCDIGLSITGIAGPGGGSIEKPVGLAYVGLAAGLDSGTETLKPGALQNSRQSDGVIRRGIKPIIKEIQLSPERDRRDLKFLFSQQALFFLLMSLRGHLTSDFPEFDAMAVEKEGHKNS